MELFSSIRGLRNPYSGEHERSGFTSLNLRQQPTLNTPSVPLGGVGFEWAYELGGGGSTVSGEAVNDDVAMRIVTVYACIRVLAHSIASLPLNLYERTKGGAKLADSTSLYYLLAVEPNNEMDRHRLWSTVVTNLLIDGNGYLQAPRTQSGQVGELYPLQSNITEPYRLPDGSLAFRTQQGQIGGWKVLKASEVCHFALVTRDGIKGVSPIAQARESLGLTRAAEKAGAKLFGNGGRPGGILTGPVGITPVQQAQVKDSWLAAHGGSNQGGTAVLPGDWKYTAITLSPEDAQFVQLRAMQRTEICALYGVPPSMVGDTTRLSNNNHEQQSLGFVTDTLKPLISILESELNRKLMPQLGRKAGAYFAQFDLSERLRGDFESQMKGFALGKQWGWYSTNDVRRKLGENTIDDPQADVYLYPTNMANADQLPAQAKTENINEQPVNELGKEPNGDENNQ